VTAGRSVPPEAVTAAYATDETWLREHLPEPELRHLLEAAAPHIAAAAVRLLEEGLHLCQHGECAPGGNETWNKWARKTEAFLRAVAAETGLSPSTLTRLGQGQKPDADALVTLLAWLNADASTFAQERPSA
jgi:hypothetical protein